MSSQDDCSNIKYSKKRKQGVMQLSCLILQGDPFFVGGFCVIFDIFDNYVYGFLKSYKCKRGSLKAICLLVRNLEHQFNVN